MTPPELKIRRKELQERVADRLLNRANTLTTNRATLLSEGAKTLAVINGAGAAALATLMTALWEKGGTSSIRHAIVIGMGFLIFGAALAAIAFWPRYLHGLSATANKPRSSPWWKVFAFCVVTSFVFFLIGMIVVLVALHSY
jgi:hypothetical protein